MWAVTGTGDRALSNHILFTANERGPDLNTVSLKNSQCLKSVSGQGPYIIETVFDETIAAQNNVRDGVYSLRRMASLAGRKPESR